MKNPLLYTALSFLMIFNNCSGPSEKPEKIYDLVKGRQILLTNDAEFKDHTRLQGASIFLINFNNTIYAVTAKHLLGENGGVEPEININDLDKYFLSWKIYPRVPVTPGTDTVKLKAGLNYESLTNDILILKTTNTSFNALPLKVETNLPEEGDDLYIIGCPYSETDCRQNIYKVEYDSYLKENATLLCTSSQNINLSGFSGAPLVNNEGNVVGTITSGWTENGVTYIGATSIQEIQKIK